METKACRLILVAPLCTRYRTRGTKNYISETEVNLINAALKDQSSRIFHYIDRDSSAAEMRYSDSSESGSQIPAPICELGIHLDRLKFQSGQSIDQARISVWGGNCSLLHVELEIQYTHRKDIELISNQICNDLYSLIIDEYERLFTSPKHRLIFHPNSNGKPQVLWVSRVMQTDDEEILDDWLEFACPEWRESTSELVIGVGNNALKSQALSRLEIFNFFQYFSASFDVLLSTLRIYTGQVSIAHDIVTEELIDVLTGDLQEMICMIADCKFDLQGQRDQIIFNNIYETWNLSPLIENAEKKLDFAKTNVEKITRRSQSKSNSQVEYVLSVLSLLSILDIAFNFYTFANSYKAGLGVWDSVAHLNSGSIINASIFAVICFYFYIQRKA